MFSLEVKKWLKNFKKYYFTYKNGVFHLPYNGNSPQSLIDSIGSLPFVKHSLSNQSVYANNPLCEGGFNYQKLEEGCWIIYAEMHYKVNLAFDLFYDDFNYDDNYYALSLNNINNVLNFDNSYYEGELILPKFSWTFLKPKEKNFDLNIKGSKNYYVTIYFNTQWLENNLINSSLFKQSKLDEFIKSDQKYIMWPLESNDPAIDNLEKFKTALTKENTKNTSDILKLKHDSFSLIFEFFKHCLREDIVKKNIVIPYSDKFTINSIENYLSKNLFSKFPGIKYLAEKFDISETKLKNEFKQIFGKTIYQYFRKKQMLLAKDLLSKDEFLVKELSYKFGYENVGKFAAAFKKENGVLPSEIKQLEETA